MTDSGNLLILTVYIISVIYVFAKAYQDLEGQITVDVDSEAIGEQLERQESNDLIEVKFKFRPSYKLEGLTKIPISIKNISSQNAGNESTVRVFWDECSIIDFSQVTGRVIRLIKGVTDIPQKQVESIILAGQVLEEELSDDKDIAAPLFKVEKLKKAIEEAKPFFLRLALKVSDPGGGNERFCVLRCPLTPKQLTVEKALVIALTPKP